MSSLLKPLSCLQLKKISKGPNHFFMLSLLAFSVEELDFPVVAFEGLAVEEFFSRRGDVDLLLADVPLELVSAITTSSLTH